MKLNQKGQDLVEFAIVLPIFIVMLMGAFYIILLCYNVIAINTLARDSARQLAVSSDFEVAKASIIKNMESSNGLLSSLYSWNPSSNSDDFKYEQGQDGSSIRVIMRARSQQSYTGAFFISKFIPDTIYGDSTMYWEKNKSS